MGTIEVSYVKHRHGMQQIGVFTCSLCCLFFVTVPLPFLFLSFDCFLISLLPYKPLCVLICVLLFEDVGFTNEKLFKLQNTQETEKLIVNN